MSAYVYTLKGPSKTVTITFADGTTAVASLLAFSHKPTSGLGCNRDLPWERLADARVARIERLWQAHGETPRYAVCVGTSSRPGEGCTVYDWHNRRTLRVDGQWMEWDGRTHTSCVDEPNMGGCKVVGRLVKAGRTWRVDAV